jgi:hypothetical protein
MAARTVVGKELAATCHRPRAELPVQIGHQVAAGVWRLDACRLQCPVARHIQVVSIGFGGQEEVEQIGESVLDGSEARAVAPALADVECGLTEAALVGVDLAQIAQVVHPTLFGARADVEVHTLDRLLRADRIFTTLQDVVHPGQHDALATQVDGGHIVVARALLPALAVAARFAPALAFVLLGAAARGLAPLVDHLCRERGPLRQVDDGVDRARVVDLVVRNGGRVGHARARVREHLPL